MNINRVIAAVFILLSTNAFASMEDIETAVMNKDYQSVQKEATDLLRHTNSSKERALAHYYIGLSQLRLGKYADSRKTFGILMQQHPDQELYDKAAVGLIEGLNMSGFYQDALKEGERYIKKNSQSSYLSVVYLKMARANLKLMRWQKANDLLNKITKDFPQSMEAPIAQGLLEEKQYFAVQVGAFEDKSRAVSLTNELKAKEFYAYIVETTMMHDNKKFYRVRVGQIASLGKAEELEKSLATLGYPTLIYP